MAPKPSAESDFLLRTRWYIWLRWFLLLAITVPSIITLYVGSGLSNERLTSLVLTLVAFGINAIFYGLSRLKRSDNYYRLLALSLLTFDVLFISYFIYSEGGIESRSQLLYALPMLMSASLFGRAGVYLTASGSALAYDAVIAANYFGIVHSPGTLTQQGTNGTYVLNTIVFFTAALLMVGVMADFITRLLLQKQREAVETAAALRQAQALAKVGSWEWDIASDSVTWSDELYDLFGVPRGEAVDYESFLGHVHPEDRKWTAAIIARALKNNRPFSFDNRVIGPDKQIRMLHGEGEVVADRRGRTIKLRGTAQDISAERMLEAAKGDFVSLASHQLRTPAGGVRMLLAMLREGYVGRLTPQQRRTVQEAYDANEHLLKIADDLLNVAKLESGRLVLNKQKVELGSWLTTLWPQQRLLARERHLNMKLQLPDRPAELFADPERLSMVIDNLLSNARKYTPAHGTITVSLQVGRRGHTITVGDTGSGMTRAEISRLFGKFTRLDNPVSKGTEGTGLGLYLAKSIVDLHRGSIKVSSRPDQGSTFIIRLPTNAA